MSSPLHDIEEQECGLTDADKHALLLGILDERGEPITIPAHALRKNRPIDTRRELCWHKHAGGAITLWPGKPPIPDPLEFYD